MLPKLHVTISPGSQADGADSIVVSGGYEDDEDDGDTIIYTGHGGNDANSKKQIADQTMGGMHNIVHKGDKVLIKINTVIPVAANAGFTTDPRMLEAAHAVGADVPVCLDPRPRIMRGAGELLSRALELPALPAVLVNPGVALATRDVFGKFIGGQGGVELADVPREFDALLECLTRHGNDLTAAASTCAPVVGEVLAGLRKLPGARLVRMSGSGSSCFALFATQREAAAAAQRLATEQKTWWVRSTSLGAAPGAP